MTLNISATECKFCGNTVPKGQGVIVDTSWEVRCKGCIVVKLQLGLIGKDLVIRHNDLHSEEIKFKIRCAAKSAGANISTAGWIAPLTMAQQILNRLVADGFKPICSPDLSAALLTAKTSALLDSRFASERLTRLATECGLRGLRLMEYQREGVAWLAPRSGALLADPYGSGKTCQVLLSLPDNAAAVVVCPASVKGVWVNEVEKWRPDLLALLATRETFSWPEAGQVIIINYESTPDMAPGIPLSGTVLIGDEAQRLMNPRAQLTQRFKLLQKQADKTWLSTATPIKGKPDELFHLLSAAGICGVFGTIHDYRALYGASKIGYKWVFGKPSPKVGDILKTVMLRRRKEDILAQLPSITIQDVPVRVWDKVHRECDRANEMLRELGVSLEQAMSSCMANKNQRLAFEELSRVYALLASAKLPAALDLIYDLESQEEPVILFSAHKAPVKSLETRPGWRVIHGDVSPAERTAIVQEMQAGELRGVAMTIATGGLGLTLTRACHAIFIDLDWTPDNNKQAEARILRIGQGRPVLIKRLVADHSLDMRMLEIHRTKMRLFEQTIDKATIPGTKPDSFPEPIKIEPKKMVRRRKKEIPIMKPFVFGDNRSLFNE